MPVGKVGIDLTRTQQASMHVGLNDRGNFNDGINVSVRALPTPTTVWQ